MIRRRLAFPVAALLITIALGAAACGKRSTRVAQGNKDQILHFGNGNEPVDLDPQIVTLTQDGHIMEALFEGLAVADPKNLHPAPGVAERWDVSPDGLVYTFHLRASAKWSNGESVTADDFVKSYERILNPTMAAPYADMLYVLDGAEDYNTGKTKDFSKVGVKAIGPATLQVTLRGQIPYFLQMLNHFAWYPVPVRIIDRNGSRYDKTNRWTRPGNIVTNGPFRLKDWKMQQEVVVVKNEKYWDAGKVRLKEIHFYPIDSADAEERAFRAGELHVTFVVPTSKLDAYRAAQSPYLRIEPFYASTYYGINVDAQKQKNPALLDVRVRRALALTVDRESLVKNVTRGGQFPAYSFVPPGPGGYQARDKLSFDPESARRLLIEAGYPGGSGVPRITILIHTSEMHRSIAEAIQQMWSKELGIDAEIVNQEMKVYVVAHENLDYQICRFGWVADYVDPNTFFELMRTQTGNNRTGYANPAYDKLVRESRAAPDAAARTKILQDAESMLLHDVPVIPIYFQTSFYLIQPSVKGWYPNALDDHSLKEVYLEDQSAPADTPSPNNAY